MHAGSNERRRERTGRSGWEEQKRAKRILRRDDGRCWICGEYGATEVDHRVPLAVNARLPEDQDLSMSFVDSEENLAAAHQDCHAKKSTLERQRASRAARE